jgi:hypothetical protein
MKKGVHSKSGLQIRGKTIRLEKAGEWPRWIQVAEAGLYLGHQSGPFEFTQQVFDQIIANFKNLPEYKKNPGKEKVIPFDWRHASERPAKSIETEHAQGWALDLRTQKAADGTVQLWALADIQDPARSLIDEEKVRFCSVSVWPDSVDPVSGKDIGFYLSSIALTNDPFIRGMVPISQAGPIAADRFYVDPWDRPQCAGDLVEALRRLFALDALAPLALVLTKLQELRQYALNLVKPPPGIDVEGLVRALRALFNLETLASVEDVFAATDKLLGAVAAEETASVQASRVPVKKETKGMKEGELIALLAGRFNCANDAATVNERIRIELEKSATTETKLKTLLAAIGAADPDAAVNELKSKLQASKDLLDAMPELGELLNEKADEEDAAAEEDVKQAVAAMRIDPQAFPEAARGVFFARTGGVELPRLQRGVDGKIDVRPLLDANTRSRMLSAFQTRRAARKAFADKTKGTAQQQHGGPQQHQSALFTRFFADPSQGGGAGPMGGAQGGAPFAFGGQHQQPGGFGGGAMPQLHVTPDGNVRLGPQGGQGAPSFGFGAPAPQGNGPALFGAQLGGQGGNAGQGQSQIPDLSERSGLQGANTVERAKTYLLSNKMVDPGNYDALMQAATQLAEMHQANVNARAQQPGARF